MGGVSCGWQGIPLFGLPAVGWLYQVKVPSTPRERDIAVYLFEKELLSKRRNWKVE